MDALELGLHIFFFIAWSLGLVKVVVFVLCR